MKTVAKIILFVLTLTIATSVCGCAGIESISRDIPRVIDLAEDVAAISQMSDPEAAIAEAEKLIHPKSGLTKESIIEQIQTNEAIKTLDLTGVTMSDVKVGDFSTPELKLNDEELGGNIYEIKVTVTVKGQPLNITLDFLSDESLMGLYSFDIKSAK
jgi:hypothetical protein